MAGDLAADYGAMGGAVSTFNTQAVQFEDALQNVTRAVEGLQGAWKGDAFESFSQLMIQWKSDAMQISELLKEIGDHVNKGTNAFQQADHDIAQGFKMFQ